MVATGIIRRIDDLGRVVIPKELRRKLEIEAGDPLEIFYNPETRTLMLSKYEPKSLEEPDIHMWDEDFKVLPPAKESIQNFIYVRCDNQDARETFMEWLEEEDYAEPCWNNVPLNHIWKYNSEDYWEDLQAKQLDLQYEYGVIYEAIKKLNGN